MLTLVLFPALSTAFLADYFSAGVIGILFVFLIACKVIGKGGIGSFYWDVDAVAFLLSAIVLNFLCTLLKKETAS